MQISLDKFVSVYILSAYNQRKEGKMTKVKVYKIRCLRCSYVWVPEKEEVLVCANPKCRSPYWNVKRKVKVLKSVDDNLNKKKEG